MGDLIRRYPLTAYFVIAYAGSWLVWAPFVLSRDGSGLLPFHSPASFLVLIGIGTFSGPTVSAFLLAHLPGAAEMTGAGVLSMYWGLALGFGLFTLLLVIVTHGWLGTRAAWPCPALAVEQDRPRSSASRSWCGVSDDASCRATVPA